jgi:peptidoglycan/LPS O-acetylase OafA/YrhL
LRILAKIAIFVYVASTILVSIILSYLTVTFVEQKLMRRFCIKMKNIRPTLTEKGEKLKKKCSLIRQLERNAEND